MGVAEFAAAIFTEAGGYAGKQVEGTRKTKSGVRCQVFARQTKKPGGAATGPDYPKLI
ncbi:hypothetical protein [Mesorhizobium sp. 1B3]|uniref:hypothetical protein n=1 Tax=Mesorhizobium sp. 1B3 TaxID=3243599 RepID=UPI003D96D340